MKQSTADIAKTRKKRPGQPGDFVGVRLQPELAGKIEEWRAEQRPIPSLPEAIRRLVEQALDTPPKKKT